MIVVATPVVWLKRELRLDDEAQDRPRAARLDAADRVEQRIGTSALQRLEPVGQVAATARELGLGLGCRDRVDCTDQWGLLLETGRDGPPLLEVLDQLASLPPPRPEL